MAAAHVGLGEQATVELGDAPLELDHVGGASVHQCMIVDAPARHLDDEAAEVGDLPLVLGHQGLALAPQGAARGSRIGLGGGEDSRLDGVGDLDGIQHDDLGARSVVDHDRVVAVA